MRLIVALGEAVMAAAGAGAAQAADTITFGIVSANPNYWAIFVARDKGFYERHGVALDLVFTGTSAAADRKSVV